MSSTYAADVAVSLRCSNPVTSEITNTLNNFIGKVSGGLGGALNLAQEILAKNKMRVKRGNPLKNVSSKSDK